MKAFVWVPRMLALFFIAFLSVFVADVFGQGYSAWEFALALFVHLVPSYILVAALIVAWRNPKNGGIFFIVLGVLSFFFFHTYRDFLSFGVVSLPAFITGGLFFLQYKKSA